MPESPTKSTAPSGGGDLRSAASQAAISFSTPARPAPAAGLLAGPSARTAPAVKMNRGARISIAILQTGRIMDFFLAWRVLKDFCRDKAQKAQKRQRGRESLSVLHS